MKNRVRKLAHPTFYAASAVALLIAFSGSASAADGSNIYLGAGYGMTKDRDHPGGDSSDQGWKAFIGGSAGRILGWEAGYVDLGKFTTGSGASIKPKGWNADILAGAPLGPVNPFVKVGAFYADVEGPTTKDRSWDWTYGAGVGFDFNKNVGMRVEYERFQVDNNDAIPHSKFDMASVSLIGKFPTR